MYILGIETSCDETAVGVVESGKIIHSNIIFSQVEKHQIFGGVVPEVAARLHAEVLTTLIDNALKKAGISFKEIFAIGVTRGPGLLCCLLVGLGSAKALAMSLKKPLVCVNHLQAHFAAVGFHNYIKFPALGLLISGGHTCLVLIEDFLFYKLLGETLDDALGEAFDKVGKMLGLPYPAGPHIERLAKEGEASAKFTRPYLFSRPFSFSFSGLKTQVLYFLKKNEGKVRPQDVCCSFQEAVVDTLIFKIKKALKKTKAKSLVVAGGVAANEYIKKRLREEFEKDDIKVYFPAKDLCVDNGAMVAGLAWVKLKKQKISSLDEEADPNLSIEED